MKVLIAGGGIAGVSAAHALLTEGIDVEVYEKSGGNREAGAAVMLSPNSTRLFEPSGLLAKLRERAVQTRAAVRMDVRDLSVMYGMRLGLEAEATFGAPLLHIHRGDLLSTLSDALPAGVLKLQAKVTGFQQDTKGVHLTLADGSTVDGDLLIAADGNRSALRNALFPASPRVFRGGWAHRALVPRDATPLASKIADDEHLLVLARAANDGLISFAGPGYLNLILGTEGTDLQLPDGRTHDVVPRDAILPLIEDWDPRMQEVFAHPEHFMRWPMYDIEPLHHWSEGRVTLVGDAAHGTLPTYGQGASMSIESAFALALALSSFADDVSEALSFYESLRIPRTREVQIGSRHLARTAATNDGNLAMLSPDLVAPGDPSVSGIGIGIPRDVQEMYGYDLRRAAEEKLWSRLSAA